MKMSNLFSRCDGLDAMIALDPELSAMVDKQDEELELEESTILSTTALIKEATEDGLDEEDVDGGMGDEIDDVNSDDYEENIGVDPVDFAADEIHDVESYDDMDIGEMIDSLMGV